MNVDEVEFQSKFNIAIHCFYFYIILPVPHIPSVPSNTHPGHTQRRWGHPLKLLEPFAFKQIGAQKGAIIQEDVRSCNCASGSERAQEDARVQVGNRDFRKLQGHKRAQEGAKVQECA